MNTPPQHPVREVMTVTRTEQVTQHYIRVYLTAQLATIANIANMTVGVNNKICIPHKGTNHLDLSDKSSFTMRTYTHRGVNTKNQEIWLEFVAHGDASPASGWAMHAKAGDKLGVMMKPKSQPLYPPADNYLLVGDATAIPVLGAILESLPASAIGQCVIEVHGKADEQTLANPAELPITWLHNPHPENGSPLADAVRNLTLPSGQRFAYVAAEFETVKTIRHFLKTEQGWSKDELFASSYWKAGVAEDKSANDRRAEKSSAEKPSLLGSVRRLLRR